MKPVPVISECPIDLLSSYPPLEAMKLLDQFKREHGDIFQLNIGGWQPNKETMNWVFLASPDLVKTFFKGDLEVLSTSRANRVLFGEMLPEQGAFTLEGKVLKKHKRIISKSLNGSELQKYVDDVRDFVKENMKQWPKTGAQPFNLLKEIHKITIATILKTIFGLELGGAFKDLTSEISKLEDPYVSEEEKLRLSGVLHEVIVSETKRKLQKSDSELGIDIFSLLLKEKEGGERALSDAEIHDELLTLLLAGFGSTSTMIAWCFETVLGSKTIYAHVKKELSSVLSTDQLQASHLQKMPYLHACILETFRLRPMFLVAGARRLNEDWTLGEYLIPKNTMVTNCSYLLHRNPDAWDQPQTFNPERFLNRDPTGAISGIQKPDPFKWAPFGSGLRRCPGMAFALQEAMVVLSEVLRELDLGLHYEVGEVRDIGHDQLAKMPERHGFFIAPKGGPQVYIK